jgi:hypothetical protein
MLLLRLLGSDLMPVDWLVCKDTHDTEDAMTRGNRRTVQVENVIRPGSVREVDAGMYDAMRRAMLKVLPKAPPGITLDEMRQRLPAHVPDALYPGGAKVGWWAKTVQLDLEAKGLLVRTKSRPLRLHFRGR